LIEGWRPGVAERLGLGPAECQARNPGLVYGRMTGFGQTGPLAQAAGHDINYVALSGALHAMGPGDAVPPLPPLNLVGDYGGGALYLAFGVMAALFERQASGRGQVVDAAMVDGVSSLMSFFHGLSAAGAWDAGRRGAHLIDGGAPFYASYATADGRFIAIGPLEPRFFAVLAGRIGLAPRFVAGQYERALWPEMREALAAIFITRSRAAWCELLEGSDACFAPVLSLAEAAGHPQAAARQAFVEVAGVRQPAPAPRFERSAAANPRPAALLAEAGYNPEQITTLLRSGVARQAGDAR